MRSTLLDHNIGGSYLPSVKTISSDNERRELQISPISPMGQRSEGMRLVCIYLIKELGTLIRGEASV